MQKTTRNLLILLGVVIFIGAVSLGLAYCLNSQDKKEAVPAIQTFFGTDNNTEESQLSEAEGELETMESSDFNTSDIDDLEGELNEVDLSGF